ncbi:hypothetical protein M9M90_19825 [Phenylobacterium sp. LH3H17]|uniref:hypothetical protein n=1 Tax=Phenylobacterium sp. LH3H17 TaxID=2903901 RepID=UPI0020C966C2|nr:hypothetical protein [Phenylobacterium sp. LH3H17]UTP39431.1 hypothetical protein M9M90_19825 [Phenylobacterium sp. LH3H17]
MTEKPFAYSLSHAEAGWAWSIFDEEGETVAQGTDLSQSGARAAVESAIARASTELRV